MELHCHSAYSLREGASTPLELVLRARELGYDALALTDHDGLYGAMEFAKAAEAWDLRPITGAELTLADGSHLTLLAATREGYGNLCRLITHAYMHSPRGDPRLDPAQLADHAAGLIALSGCSRGTVPTLLTAGRYEDAAATARQYATWFGDEGFFLELQQNLVYGDTSRTAALADLAARLGLGTVATNNVHYHVRSRHRLHDVLVAVRHRLTLDTSHRERRANSEFYLKPAGEMAALFERYPEAVANTRLIAERCRFHLGRDLDYRFPGYEPRETALTPDPSPIIGREGPNSTESPQDLSPGQQRDKPHSTEVAESLPLTHYWERGPGGEGHSEAEAYVALYDFCQTQLRARYNTVLEPARFQEALDRLREEMRLIKKHGLAGFFLCYRDILELSKEVAAEVYGRDPRRPKDERPPGRGRGSSVGSIVCYLIGLSHIDPIANNLFLGRFLNEEMSSVPDIDIDFPREIRERLIERMYDRYGREHVALVCTFPTYQIRSAVRDVGKALGLPAAELDKLAKLSGWAGAGEVAAEMARLPEFQDRVDAPVWRDLVALAKELDGMPRHVSQHVGGMVISSRPLVELVPVEPAAMAGRYLLQWDKDSVDDARFIKIDFLALGMLSLVDECLDLLLEERGQHPDLGRISHTDSRVFDMICAGDTLGVFQIESRAQIQTLPRTRPRSIEDLTVEVAIIRPGPITGGALNPYILRRQGREPVTYDLPELEPVLKETLGVILYQEQVLQVAMIAAGFTAGQAESLRRAMSRKRSREALLQLWTPFRDGARSRGVPDEVAKTIFKKLLGFATFGFPKSHSAAFALLAYESAWLKLYYPAHFYAALFNNQPMGFYAPAVLTGDARRHGVRVLPPDVNRSAARCTVEDGDVRLGFNYVEGLGGTDSRGRGRRPDPPGPVDPPPGPLPQGRGSLAGPFLGRPAVDSVQRSGPEEAVSAGSPSLEGGGRGVGPAGRRVMAGEAISRERALRGPYRSLFDFVQRTGLRREQVENLIAVGAFDGFGLGRRELLWQLGLIVRPVREQLALPLPVVQDMVRLPEPDAWERTAAEYALLGLSPEGHPMALMRPRLHEGIATSAHLERLRDGMSVTVAGLVVCRQRPMTARGFLFLSLEDEHGLTNVIVKPWLYEKERILLRAEPFLLVSGRLQLKDGTTNVVAARVQPLAVGPSFAPPRSHDWG